MIEHPLTYLHRDAMATIAQRDAGIDVPSLADGIRMAIRQRADLLGVGDVDEHAAAEQLLRAAENGITVLACTAATDAASVPSMLLRHFPPGYRRIARQRLESVLVATLLVPDEGESEFHPSVDLESAISIKGVSTRAAVDAKLHV